MNPGGYLGKYQFGTGALYGIILFVIMIVVGLVQLRLIRSEDGEGW